MVMLRCLCVAPLLLAAVAIADDSPATADIAALIQRLPTNGSTAPRDPQPIESLVKHGEAALPALQKELQPGIQFKTLNVQLQNNQSRRYAVTEVVSKIPGDRSTELLVATLSDPVDNYAMQVIILESLKTRKLTAEQVVKLLTSHDPQIALAGIARSAEFADATNVKDAVERLFDSEQTQVQFRNEYGSPTANKDALWNVRVAAAEVLGRDLLKEKTDLARENVAILEAQARKPTEPDQPVRMSSQSKAEYEILAAISRLESLGEPARNVVAAEAKTATGDYRKLLAMAQVRFGDRSQIPQVAEDLKTSKVPTIRYCAAMTLRLARDRTAVPALRTALKDSYQRVDTSCVRAGEMFYPIRQIAADALISLGEDANAVRSELRKP